MTREESNERLFYRCEQRSPGLKPVIDFIKEKSDIDIKERRQLYVEFSKGSIIAKQRFIEYFMRNALQLAYLYSKKTGIDLDELFSVAYEIEVDTIEKFTFKSEKYLYLYVCNHILRGLVKYTKEFNKSVPLEYVSNWSYDGEKVIMEYVHNRTLIELVEKTEVLSYEERTLVMGHLDLSGKGEKSLTDIGKELDIKGYHKLYRKYMRGLEKLAELDIFQVLHNETQQPATTCANNNISVETIMKLQFFGMEFDLEEIRKAVEADCKAKNYTPVTSLEIYVKPEDKAAYYVANKTIADKIDWNCQEMCSRRKPKI